MLVLVKGAGELASGVAWRLFRCGFGVVMTEVERPLAVRRTVSFCEAIYDGQATVEGVTARRAASVEDAGMMMVRGCIPVLVDPTARCRAALKPEAVVDAIMAKRNLGTSLRDAEAVIGLGPGFTAGRDCHAAVETQRGHTLGRVFYQGSALADTGVPAERGGVGVARVVRAPVAGAFRGIRQIGSLVEVGDLLGYVDEVPVVTGAAGVLRGLIRDGAPVSAGLKVGDVDPIADRQRCYTLSDKALAVAGGVLEALLVLLQEG